MAASLQAAILIVAAVVMAACSSPRSPRDGPRVMAVEFDGRWAGAVLEGNEIVPGLVQISFEELPERLVPRPGLVGSWGKLDACWHSGETSEAPKGWRERLTPQQAREFEDIYCDAVVSRSNVGLVDCAWVRGEGLDCTERDFDDWQQFIEDEGGYYTVPRH